LELLQATYEYYLANQGRFWRELGQHLNLSLSALSIALVIAIPLGIWIARRAALAQPVISAFGALRLIPSLAVLFLALPYLGTGYWPALVALTVLAIPPVLINSYAGIRNIDRALVEAASGVGMAPRQVLWRVEVPLAMPVIIAGIRTAAVEVVSSATLAAFIGGGGLGVFITRGFALLEPRIMLVGAVSVALLALLAELLLALLQRRLSGAVA
jgi:osmoprotectant transport system permease protein